MIRRGLWGLTTIATEIGGDPIQLTEEHIEYSLACFLANRKNRRANKDAEYYVLKVAQDIIGYYMGKKLLQERLLSRNDSFFGISQDSESSYRYGFRVIRLAEILYNLQRTTGVEHRLGTLKHDDLESILGEMECASFLYNADQNFRFVVPANDARRGSCYDAELTTAAGAIINCEMKAKSKETPMTAESVWNTCEHARRQLPKGKPGLILLRLPEVWSSTSDFKSVMRPGLEKAVRQSDRLVGIVIVWESWFSTAGQERLCIYAYDAWLNKRSKLFDEDIYRSISMLGTRPSSWASISQFVGSRLDELMRRIPIV